MLLFLQILGQYLSPSRGREIPENQAAEQSVSETPEEYYVLKEEMLTKLEDIKGYKEQLLSSEPVRAQLDRQLCVFKPSPQAARFELPNDFYNLTAEEIKREQRLRLVELPATGPQK
ncbi:ubx domain-containing protein 6 [Limosa lapponica baueri]|uniref:Ubx domain-containing protein 6 n=1 Tax=Limosa lapponica baueri TaxID=1758121 RepID=A0A2I0T9V7_LIMLA|nr:ubx domain-containing protein 6 [Limosa lapponica baueri]